MDYCHRLDLAGLVLGGGGAGPDPRYALPGTEPRYAPDRAFDTTHIQIAIDLDLARRAAAAQCWITLTAFRDSARELAFDQWVFKAGHPAPRPASAPGARPRAARVPQRVVPASPDPPRPRGRLLLRLGRDPPRPRAVAGPIRGAGAQARAARGGVVERHRAGGRGRRARGARHAGDARRPARAHPLRRAASVAHGGDPDARPDRPRRRRDAPHPPRPHGRSVPPRPAGDHRRARPARRRPGAPAARAPHRGDGRGRPRRPHRGRSHPRDPRRRRDRAAPATARPTPR